MLDLFKRQRPNAPSGSGGSSDSGQRSHIFPKFLKRLVGRERPIVLDLGRLSGGNIEIFARVGCRVQVEDLITLAEEKSGGEPDRAVALTPVVETGAATPAPGGGTSSQPGAGEAAPPAPTGAPGTTTGARPSRRIVLPPRTFARSMTAPAGARPPAPSAQRTPLATRFGYADESFDGIVAWDLFNYYDPESGRVMAADVARILKPGGLVFAYFHARTLGVPPGPGRYRIIDETRIDSEPFAGRPLPHHVFQNRDIEKMFTGLRIAELYFLKSGVREMLLEKRTPASAPPSGPPVARPRSRFRID